MDKKNLTRMKTKTSPEYKSVIVCIFSIAVIWVVIFNFQKHCVTGLLIFKKFCENNPDIYFSYFHIKMVGWGSLKLT